MTNPLQQQIEAQMPEEKVILDKIDAGDNKYWKSNRNHDMGYNLALSLCKQSLPKIIELIEKDTREKILSQLPDYKLNKGYMEYKDLPTFAEGWNMCKNEVRELLTKEN